MEAAMMDNNNNNAMDRSNKNISSSKITKVQKHIC